MTSCQLHGLTSGQGNREEGGGRERGGRERGEREREGEKERERGEERDGGGTKKKDQEKRRKRKLEGKKGAGEEGVKPYWIQKQILKGSFDIKFFTLNKACK